MPIFLSIRFLGALLLVNCFVFLGYSEWCPDQAVDEDRKFEQKTDKFWEFDEKSNSWVSVDLPYDLFSCLNDTCLKVGSINPMKNEKEKLQEKVSPRDDIQLKDRKKKDISELISKSRRRISLTKISDSSIWITGESGSIYERFWNGVQWVIAPHHLPISAGPAIGVFMLRRNLFASSEAGILYQMRLDSSDPDWVELTPNLNLNSNIGTVIKAGVVSPDRMRIYFCTKNGTLIELIEDNPPRWENHGTPFGADVAAIVDAGGVRSDVIYTISSSGDLYEYDKLSKPSWKKHIPAEAIDENLLLPSSGFALHGKNSASFFLLNKRGKLVERRFHQKKWRWISHEGPNDHLLTSITPVPPDDSDKNYQSLYLTSSCGSVFEYQIPKSPGSQYSEKWTNHKHPYQSKIATGIAGLHLQRGRLVFPIADGRIAELHLPGLGGDLIGPNHQINTRRKASTGYRWSMIETPESEGWNAEYCKAERGPMNCIIGVKDESIDSESARSTKWKRRGRQAQEVYLVPDSSSSKKHSDTYTYPINWVNSNFRLRSMYGERSIFLVTDNGLSLEYLDSENIWLWMMHEHPTSMMGALGTYNRSVFLVDLRGDLFVRDSSNGGELINCTAMRNGKQVVAGPPWEEIPERGLRIKQQDSIFFVSKGGRLVQFMVGYGKFKWKDCKNPANIKVASIVDQELFRENIVFVIGRNGRLYQYNRVTELWHEHYQSQHLMLSKLPGTAVRSSFSSLSGSLFMLSEDWGLIEYQWSAGDGWNWVEHGTPGVSLVTSPSPCFGGQQLFFVGSDGNVYMRFMNQLAWSWKNCGFPLAESWNEKILTGSSHGYPNCDSQVAPTRPIQFETSSIVFELKDRRLAVLQQVEGTRWDWSRIINTPTTSCILGF